jgi:hypothetical protein
MMRTLRTYTSSAEAIGDIAALESQGITPAFKGDAQGDANQALMGTVELQVANEDYEEAARLLSAAEKDRVERYIPAAKRKKTPERYFRITLVAFVLLFIFVAIETPFLSGGLMGYVYAALVAGGLAAMIGFCCALFDL